MSTLRCTVRELPQSPGFLHHRPALTRLNHFPWVGIVWMAYSAICLLRLHSPGGEDGKKGGQAWLLCLFVLHMSDGCNTNNATPAKRMQVINCWWRKKKPHYPNAIITPNDKSCLASRWIMLMLVACAHRAR